MPRQVIRDSILFKTDEGVVSRRVEERRVSLSHKEQVEGLNLDVRCLFTILA